MDARWASGLILGLIVGVVLAIAFGAFATDDDGGDTVSCGDLDAAALGALVVVNSPSAGDTVSDGFTLEGCAATFEQNVQYRVTDRTGATVAEGFTTASASDIGVTGEFTTDVQLSEAEDGILTLEVFEEDVSEGEGGVPPRHVVPLVTLGP